MPLSASQRSAPRSSVSNKLIDNFDTIVVALSLFLEIDSYGAVLVEYDKVAAKKLIYIMLGIAPPSECSVSLFNYSQASR